MPELKRFTVFGTGGRVGTLSALARFLDNRSEKTIQLDNGGEIAVPSDALEVRPDGSFFLREALPEGAKVEQQKPEATPEPPVARNGSRMALPVMGDGASVTKLYEEGYDIERIQVDRLITEPVSQRQEGDTLILPVVEEVLVVEKRLMLREEIRITRRRDEVKQIRTIDGTFQP